MFTRFKYSKHSWLFLKVSITDFKMLLPFWVLVEQEFSKGGNFHSSSFVFAMPHGMQDLSSPTRDWTHVPCSGSTVLTTWPPRKSSRRAILKPPPHQRRLAMLGDILFVTIWGWRKGAASGIWWVEASNASFGSYNAQTTPHHKDIHVDSNEVGKACCGGMWFVERDSYVQRFTAGYAGKWSCVACHHLIGEEQGDW